MSIERLTEKYGPYWSTQPPPQAKTLILEGALNISDLPDGNNHVILQWQGEENTIAVVQSIRPFAYDVIYPQRDFVALEPAALTGNFTYFLRENERLKNQQGTQFVINNGYDLAPNDGENSPEAGLSLFFPINVDKSPFIIPENKGFDLILQLQNPNVGAPLPQDARRFFAARVTGFTLYTY